MVRKNVILEKHIMKFYNMNSSDFAKHLAHKYIKDTYQKSIFVSQGVWMKVQLNYIAGLILHQEGRDFFSPKEIRTVIRTELIPSLINIRDKQLSGMILTQDVHKTSKQEYNNGHYCLERIERGRYRFVGFQ